MLRTGNQAGCPGTRSSGSRPRILTVVLKATRGNPQVKVPAPSLETGSYPKDSRRHGQPAPIVAGPAYPAPPDQPSRPQTAPRSGSDPRQTTTRSPAPNSQGCATAAAIELRRPFHAGGQLLLSWWGPVSSSSGYRPMSMVSAPFWHTAGMTSLEDRYGFVGLDMLIRKRWSRGSGNPLLTASAPESSWHLVRVWPRPRHAQRDSHLASTAQLRS